MGQGVLTQLEKTNQIAEYKSFTIDDLEKAMQSIMLPKPSQIYYDDFYRLKYKTPIHLEWSNHLIESYFKNTDTRRFLKDIWHMNQANEYRIDFAPNSIPNEHDIDELKIFLALYNLKLNKPDWDIHYYAYYEDT